MIRELLDAINQIFGTSSLAHAYAFLSPWEMQAYAEAQGSIAEFPSSLSQRFLETSVVQRCRWQAASFVVFVTNAPKGPWPKDIINGC